MSQSPQSVVLRPLHTAADAEGIHAVIVGCAEADQIDPFSTLEGITPLPDVVEELVRYDPSLFCVAEVNSQIVGYNRLLWWEEEHDVWLYLHLGRVLPTFRGQGIGTALLKWSEGRIRQVEQPRGTPIYGANASSTETDATQLLRDHGYETVFTVAQMHFNDFHALPPVTLADDMLLRAPTPDDALAMRITVRAAWSKGVFGVEKSQDEEEEIVRMRENITQQGAMWRVIMVGDVVAGKSGATCMSTMACAMGLSMSWMSIPIFVGAVWLRHL